MSDAPDDRPTTEVAGRAGGAGWADIAGGAGGPGAADTVHWARIAAAAADAKRGADTVILDVGNVLAITELFVVTSASNTRLVKTIAEEVEEQVRQAGGPGPIQVEGVREQQWVLVDYGDFVVHVFLDEARRFYDIERLYRDVARVAWSPLALDDGAR